MKKPNSHNSPLNAYKVISAWKNYPKGLINSQAGIIFTYYSGKHINNMPNRQIIAFSKRLYGQAGKVWKSLTLGEKQVIKVLAERPLPNQIEDLEERVAILLYQNEIPEDSPVMPDIKRMLDLGKESEILF